MTSLIIDLFFTDYQNARIFQIIAEGVGVGCWEAEDRKNKGLGYRGTQSVTRKGATCQKWSSNSPQSHTYMTRADV